MADYATEQTLQELLAQAKVMAASLTRMTSILGRSQGNANSVTGNSGSGGSSSGGGGAASNLMGQASKFLPLLGPAGKAMSLLTSVVSGLSSIFGGLASMITSLFGTVSKVVGILGEFAGAASHGTMKLSDMIDVMGDLANEIPIVGGLLKSLAGIASMIIKRQEENLVMYQKLSSVGAVLGGGLGDLRMRMNATGLSFDEYQKVVLAHAQDFAQSGGDVQTGTKKFELGMTQLMGKDSALRREMYGLGYTTEGVAKALSSFMVVQGGMAKQSQGDVDRMTSGAVEYSKQLTYLAEATGQQREQIEEQVKKKLLEVATQDWLKSLDKDKAAKAQEIYATAVAQGGEKYGQYILNSLRTGIATPLEKEGAKLFVGTGGKVVDAAQMNIKAFNDNAVDAKEAGAIAMKSAVVAANGQNEITKKLGLTGRILDSTNQSIQDGGLRAQSNRIKEAGGTEEYLKKQAELRNKTEGQGNNQAAELADITQRIRLFGKKVDDMITILAGPFIGPIMGMSDSFLKIAEKFATWIKPKIEEFANWLTPWVKKFTEVQSWDDFKKLFKEFWEDIKVKSAGIWKEVKETMGPLIKDVWETVKPIMKAAIIGLFDFLWDAMKTSVIPRWARKDTEAETQADRQEEIDKLKKQIAQQEAGYQSARANNQRYSPQTPIEIEKMKKKLAELEKVQNPQSTANAASVKSSSTEAAAPPAGDNAKLARDWAYSIMTGRNTDAQVPPELKDAVTKLKSDTGLKAQADKYLADQKAKEEAARQEQATRDQAARDAAANPNSAGNAAAPATAPSKPAVQTAPAAGDSSLNTSLGRQIQLLQEIADNTKKTASAAAAGGNLFRHA